MGDGVVADEQLALALERVREVVGGGFGPEDRRVGLVGEHDHEHVLDRAGASPPRPSAPEPALLPAPAFVLGRFGAGLLRWRVLRRGLSGAFATGRRGSVRSRAVRSAPRRRRRRLRPRAWREQHLQRRAARPSVAVPAPAPRRRAAPRSPGTRARAAPSAPGSGSLSAAARRSRRRAGTPASRRRRRRAPRARGRVRRSSCSRRAAPPARVAQSRQYCWRRLPAASRRLSAGVEPLIERPTLVGGGARRREQRVHHRRRVLAARRTAVARQPLHQRRSALPAEDSAAAVGRGAVRAAARASPLLHPQQPLDLGELGVSLLQHGRAPHEHVEPEVVADRHLVGQPAEVPVQLGDLLGERVAAPAQLRAARSGPRRAAGAGGSLGARPASGTAGCAAPLPSSSPGCARSARRDDVGEVLRFFLVALALGVLRGLRARRRGRVFSGSPPPLLPSRPDDSTRRRPRRPSSRRSRPAITPAAGKLFFSAPSAFWASPCLW